MQVRFVPVLLAAFLLTGLSAAQQPKAQAPQKQAPPASTPPPAAADDNPFPEDVSRKAAEAAKQQQEAKPEAPASPVTSEPPASGESSSSSGYKPLDDEDEAAPASPERRKLRLDGESAIGTPHADRIALRDEEIADLYFKDGNYAGALSRYAEALHFVPDDETAAFGVAESARKLRKRDQAVEAYKTYLKLAPQGKKAKQARKAIAELESPQKH
jgi:tetratricopeptide (TPR) repeat protein